MKQLILVLTLIATTFVNAQNYVDLSTFAGTAVSGSRLDNNEVYYSYSANVTGTGSSTTIVNAGDTVFLHYTVGNINDAAIQGSSTGNDTLELDLAFVSWRETTDASYTISYNLGSYFYTNINGVHSSYDTYKFLEGETDTIMIVITTGNVEFDRFDVNSTTDNVITNIEHGLLSSNTIITNPVEDGLLSIDLDGHSTSLELLNLSGKIVKQFEVNGSETVDVHELVSGLYILRDISSNSFKKIMIR